MSNPLNLSPGKKLKHLFCSLTGAPFMATHTIGNFSAYAKAIPGGSDKFNVISKKPIGGNDVEEAAEWLVSFKEAKDMLRKYEESIFSKIKQDLGNEKGEQYIAANFSKKPGNHYSKF